MLDVLYSVFQLKVPELTSEYRIAVASIGMCVCAIYVYVHVCVNKIYKHTVPDIIKFTYYHCTSIDYSVHCE